MLSTQRQPLPSLCRLGLRFDNSIQMFAVKRVVSADTRQNHDKIVLRKASRLRRGGTSTIEVDTSTKTERLDPILFALRPMFVALRPMLVALHPMLLAPVAPSLRMCLLFGK